MHREIAAVLDIPGLAASRVGKPGGLGRLLRPRERPAITLA
ncbi:hypothetical protein [Promicromonospora kroppenstedtii]|nr:hypothetical protein [Promicromonospora kroppenstedtii]